MKKIYVLLTIMLVFSFFGGVPINGSWIYAYEFEKIDFSSILKTFPLQIVVMKFTCWGILILSHIGILSLLFFVNKPYFKKMLFWLPLVYLVSFALLNYVFVLLLIPFMLFWLISLATPKS